MWGIIQRPSNFDPNKKYPVIEYIYSGPGDQYVPKTFTPWLYNLADLAELGFIVIQLDAMTTSFRSLDFEQVCYKNLKDSGFPDRVAWIKAAAEKYPYMDIENMGIYGCSAGGQEALGALLFHGDFYKAAYSACGCHDNRMDKIWWNEQWMGYPVDDSYKASSNVENAKNLKGKLMLVVGEMDDNVEINIAPEDIKMDVYRASGAGGQKVNKTSSAVRLTHIPTGIVVASQVERSQYQNRDVAMKMLVSKLVEIKEREHLEKIEDIKGVQKEITWGSQIRSYVFMPYTMVKDHRTSYETGNIQAVMDGDLDGFINAYLKCASQGTLLK
jgi:hypothetical protein